VAVSVLPEKRRPRRLTAVAALLVAAMWAILALYLARAVGATEWDGDCYAPRPTWAILQALVAIAGLNFLVRAALRAWSGARGSAKLFGFAALGLVGWLIIWFVLGGAAEIVLCPGQPPNSI
jgi:hypothetical protein